MTEAQIDNHDKGCEATAPVTGSRVGSKAAKSCVTVGVERSWPPNDTRSRNGTLPEVKTPPELISRGDSLAAAWLRGLKSFTLHYCPCAPSGED